MPYPYNIILSRETAVPSPLYHLRLTTYGFNHLLT